MKINTDKIEHILRTKYGWDYLISKCSINISKLSLKYSNFLPLPQERLRTYILNIFPTLLKGKL